MSATAVRIDHTCLSLADALAAYRDLREETTEPVEEIAARIWSEWQREEDPAIASELLGRVLALYETTHLKWPLRKAVRTLDDAHALVAIRAILVDTNKQTMFDGLLRELADCRLARVTSPTLLAHLAELLDAMGESLSPEGAAELLHAVEDVRKVDETACSFRAYVANKFPQLSWETKLFVRHRRVKMFCVFESSNEARAMLAAIRQDNASKLWQKPYTDVMIEIQCRNDSDEY